MNLKRYIGDRKFYAMVLAIAVPIMVQNGITNFVAMIDNIMIGRVGTEQMSGVAVVNQLLFVFNLSVFGMLSGAGIFGAQFFGSGNTEGFRNTFRFKLLSCFLLTMVGILLFLTQGERLIMLYLHDESGSGMVELTLNYGMRYLRIMLTVAPMRAGIMAVATNTVLDYVLIFGIGIIPGFGVEGAAAATVVARCVECVLIVSWTHRRAERFAFIRGVYRSMKVPGSLAVKILVKGSPLMFNEFIWALGMAMLAQCYSTYGLEVIAAQNISSTISNVCNVIWIAMGNAIAIIIGQLLGAGKLEEAKDTDRKLIFFSVASCFGIAVLLVGLAFVFPHIYNTEQSVRALATQFILISAVMMPAQAFLNASYFTIRSGGKTGITFFFDGGFMWICTIPLAFVLSRFSGFPILVTYLLCQIPDLIKCMIGYILVKKGIWIENLVGAGES